MATTPDVTIYTTATCTYCQAEKAWLRRHQLPYHEVPVDSDKAAAERMIELSGQMNVPVTVVGQGDNQELVVGFDEPRLAAAIGLQYGH